MSFNANWGNAGWRRRKQRGSAQTSQCRSGQIEYAGAKPAMSVNADLNGTV
ncbi:unnamed protein product [Mycetohabitans rhizoxinica HKI 454]|uniref:Uncharacterized protein n=1 Tax=Mycetohabitans rhizoxinica (strain DSM 19002 / CIP 109453 / HKI 454) TaxID=882378 RepID=E5ALP6_MYCRK|nr:unnamed protein product [Mycetohabitans rhizoxinica HKI 454]